MDFISDDEMVQIEAQNPAPAGDDFISDDDMSVLEASQPQTTEQVSQSLAQKIAEPILSTGAGAAVGATGGLVAKKIAAPLANKAIELSGKLDADQLNYIRQNPAQYKSARDLESVLGDYQQLMSDVQQSGYRNASQAKDFLRSAPNVPKEQLYQTLGKTVQNLEGAVNEISPDFAGEQLQSIRSEVGAKMTPEMRRSQSLSKQIQDLQQQAQTFESPEISKSLEQLLAEKSALDQKLVGQSAKQQSEVLDLYNQRIRGIPSELIQANPQLVGSSLAPDYRPTIQSTVDLVKAIPGESVPASTLGGEHGLIPRLREGVNFNSDGSVGASGKLDKRLSEDLRNLAGELYPEYDEKMKTSSRAIGLQEQAQRFGIKVNPVTNEIEFPAASKKKIADILTGNKALAGEERDILEKLLQESQEFSSKRPAGGLKPGDAEKATNAFIDEVNAANIKNIVNDAELSGYQKSRFAREGARKAGAAGMGALVGGQTAGTPGAVVGAGLGLAADAYGTKLQELLALSQGSKLGRAGAALLEKAPIIGGVIGGLAGASSAMAQDLDAPSTALAAAGEAVNPIPFTDVASGIKAAQTLPKSETPEIDAQQVDELGKPISRETDAFIKGYAQPLLDVGQSAVSDVKKGLESFGTQASNDARARMEQRFNAGKNVSANKPSKSQEINNITPFRIKEMQIKLQNNPGAAPFNDLLTQAAQAEPRKRAALLFGLSQQPGFQKVYEDLLAQEREEEDGI